MVVYRENIKMSVCSIIYVSRIYSSQAEFRGSARRTSAPLAGWFFFQTNKCRLPAEASGHLGVPSLLSVEMRLKSWPCFTFINPYYGWVMKLHDKLVKKKSDLDSQFFELHHKQTSSQIIWSTPFVAKLRLLIDLIYQERASDLITTCLYWRKEFASETAAEFT